VRISHDSQVHFESRTSFVSRDRLTSQATRPSRSPPFRLFPRLFYTDHSISLGGLSSARFRSSAQPQTDPQEHSSGFHAADHTTIRPAIYQQIRIDHASRFSEAPSSVFPRTISRRLADVLSHAKTPGSSRSQASARPQSSETLVLIAFRAPS
jgi:hypothetical protein